MSRKHTELLGIALAASVILASSARADDISASLNSAGEALAKGDHQSALQAAEAGLAKAPGNFFLLYDKGAAQAGLGKIDDALATLQQAESKAPDAHWRSLTVYRRAVALQNAGRCSDAVAQYNAFAGMVQSTDGDSAALAQRYASSCRVESERHNVSGASDKE